MTRSDHRDWYARTYPELSGHGLWLRGGELNTLPPEEAERRPLRVLFTRLSTYFDTGYSFTHQLLYQIAADTPGVFPDLAYLPPEDDEAILARDGVPWLLGTQTKRGPAGFDVVGFSNSTVQELVNLAWFLERSGIPASMEERLGRADMPLLILGGANALYTSVLWGPHALVDGVFVGESDAAIRAILETCRDAKQAGLDKAAVLALLERIDGFFRADRPRRTQKAFVSDLNASAALERGPVYHLADQLGVGHLQISEGCPCFCSFCAESWDRKPYRERKPSVLADVATRAKAAMGLERMEVYSFNFNMHSGFYRILWDLVPLFRGVGLKSQRFDLLAHDPEMVHFQHAIEKASLTCGLEGISPRLRRYLHKNLEQEDLHASLAAIFRSRARSLKVFLIATGLEEEQDFAELAALLEHAAAVRAAAGARTRLVFSMTPLVRFPWTPLEYEDGHPIARYRPILERTSRLVRRAGFEFRAAADLCEYWLSQVLVRAADARILPALLAALARTGFVYRRRIPAGFLKAFQDELRARGIEPDELLRGHDFEQGEAKPWTAIETGVTRAFLWAEVLRARRFREIDYCLGRSWTPATCFQCGGCPTPAHVRAIVHARQERDYELEPFQARVRAAREAEVDVPVRVSAGPAARGLPRRALGVAFARALMLAEPALAPHYRGYGASALAGREDRPLWAEGEDVLTLRFARAALARLEALLADAARRAAADAQLGEWGRVLGRGDEGWRPERIAFDAPCAFRGEAWLRSQSLAYTLRRRGEGSYELELAAKALARDVVRTLAFERRAEGARVELAPGRRFELEPFLRAAFELPRPDGWVRIRAHVFGPQTEPATPARVASAAVAAAAP